MSSSLCTVATLQDRTYWSCDGRVKTALFLQFTKTAALYSISFLFVIYTAAPILTGVNQMRDEIVPVGKKATFRCEAESLPNEEPPTFPIWKKNGVDLVIDGGCLIVCLF